MAVLLLVKQEFGLELPIHTMGEYLKRRCSTPQKPLKRAQAEDAEIHWGDYTALVNTDVRGRGYQHKGQTRWIIVEDAFNSDKLIESLQSLVKDPGKKIFLILDNLRVYHSKPVKAWLAEYQRQIEVYYLPSYSPNGTDAAGRGGQTVMRRSTAESRT